MPAPGDDLTAMTDAELVEVIRSYGLTAPWYGDEDERTPEGELHARRPWLRGLRYAADQAWMADTEAQGTMMTLKTVESPATERLRQLYEENLQRALTAMSESPSFEVAADAYRASRRAHSRATATLKTAVAREENGYSERAMAELAEVDRMTIRSWRGKR